MVGRKIRRWKVHPEGYIYEVYFGYNAKMRVYTNSSSDITKLSAIGH